MSVPYQDSLDTDGQCRMLGGFVSLLQAVLPAFGPDALCPATRTAAGLYGTSARTTWGPRDVRRLLVERLLADGDWFVDTRPELWDGFLSQHATGATMEALGLAGNRADHLLMIWELEAQIIQRTRKPPHLPVLCTASAALLGTRGQRTCDVREVMQQHRLVVLPAVGADGDGLLSSIASVVRGVYGSPRDMRDKLLTYPLSHWDTVAWGLYLSQTDRSRDGFERACHTMSLGPFLDVVCDMLRRCVCVLHMNNQQTECRVVVPFTGPPLAVEPIILAQSRGPDGRYSRVMVQYFQ